MIQWALSIYSTSPKAYQLHKKNHTMALPNGNSCICFSFIVIFKGLSTIIIIYFYDNSYHNSVTPSEIQRQHMHFLLKCTLILVVLVQ